MPIKACQGCLKDMFLTTTEAVDCFTGKELWVWGQQGTQYQGSGALGDGTGIARSSPVQTISSGTNWKQVDAGNGTSAAIKQDGTLWTWGNNYFGHLGTNDRINRSSPVQTVSGGSNWKCVSVGISFTLGLLGGIKTDGTLWMWGGGTNAQGSFGGLGDNTITNKSSPVQTISGGTNWKSISVGGFGASAIKTDGTLWVWGFNGVGELGDGTIVTKSSPVQTISGGNDWAQISFGIQTNSAIKTDGTLWMWGQNDNGQLGIGNTLNRSSPVQTISGGTNWKQVSTARALTVAIKTDGSLWLWGGGSGGRIGDNAQISRSSPVQTVSGGTNWRCADAGNAHTTALKTDGTLWNWGSGLLFAHQTGDNTTIFRSSPVQTVSGGTNWKTIAAGYHHSIGIKEVEF